jgi:hypothetical protein
MTLRSLHEIHEADVNAIQELIAGCGPNDRRSASGCCGSWSVSTPARSLRSVRTRSGALSACWRSSSASSRKAMI